MIQGLKYLNAYKDIVSGMTFSDFISIIKAFGEAILFDVNKLPDHSDTEMTKSDYLARLKSCNGCPVRNGVICDPTRHRAHKYNLKEDGSPVMVNGCGCNLLAKQKSPNHSCPAGEWKVFIHNSQ